MSKLPTNITRDLRELCARLDGIRVDAELCAIEARKNLNPGVASLMFLGLRHKIVEVQQISIRTRDEVDK